MSDPFHPLWVLLPGGRPVKVEAGKAWPPGALYYAREGGPWMPIGPRTEPLGGAPPIVPARPILPSLVPDVPSCSRRIVRKDR